jgi:uncharacterized DUF497 family protein
MDVEVTGFEWDAGNREKCEKHGVSLREIEILFKNRPAVIPDPAHSRSETRYRAIGRVQQRYIFVAFTLRDTGGETVIRPISARYMHDKEVRHYGRE